MNKEFFFEIVSPTIILGIIFFLVAEFFGRSKHIGRWWTFFLMFAIFPGIIALIFSPNAKQKPTKGNNTHTIFATILLILPFILILGKMENYEISDFFITIGLISSALYLINFAGGKIINHNPKFYFENNLIKTKNPIHHYVPADKNQFVYFIIENGRQLEKPLTFAELKEKKISEKTFVWRNGLEAWLQAKELAELRSIIIYSPPPFFTAEVKKQSSPNPPPFNL